MTVFSRWAKVTSQVALLCMAAGADLVHASPQKDYKIVDLTHDLATGLPDFHLGENGFVYEPIYSVKDHGYANGKFCTPEHYGTHIDAPSHFVEGGSSIDRLDVDKLVAPCVVIDVRDEVKHNPDYVLTVDRVKQFELKGEIPPDAVVFLLTGWADRWSDPKAYRNADELGTMHFPAFSQASAEFLVNERHIAGLGDDTLSADCGNSRNYGVHRFSLAKGIFLIENVANLDKLPARNATIICAPLKIKNGTGSPARIMAMVHRD
jgi:kynurenine formamidase